MVTNHGQGAAGRSGAVGAISLEGAQRWAEARAEEGGTMVRIVPPGLSSFESTMKPAFDEKM